MGKLNNTDQNQQRSHAQSGGQVTGLFTGTVQLGESEVTIGVVDANGRVLSQANCAFTGTPAHVSPHHKIPAILGKLALSAHIGNITASSHSPGDTNGRSGNGLLTGWTAKRRWRGDWPISFSARRYRR